MAIGLNRWDLKKFNIRVFKTRNDFIEMGEIAANFNDNSLYYIDLYSAQKGIKQNFNYKSYIDFGNLTKMKNEKKYEKWAYLQEQLKNFDDFLSEIDMGGAFKKAKLKITDDKRGIFDFGIASKGLYKAQEYFSKELAIDSPDEFAEEKYGNKPSGVVPFDFVKEVMVLNTKQFWYTSFKTNKKYILTKQDEGKRAIELGLPGAKYNFKTNIKKSYLMIEKKGGKAKMVELYFPIHASVKIVQAFPLFLVAKFLQQYGIMTKISAIRVYNESTDGKFIMYSYPVKDYGEEMDFNYMALNGIDNRWWKAVQVIVRSINDRVNINKKRGNSTEKIDKKNITFYNGQGGAPDSLKDYLEVFARYKNFYMNGIKKGELEPLRVDKRLMFIGGTFGGDTMDVEDNKKEIVQEFYRILDSVDFQFNKAEKVCERIYKRMVTDKLDKEYEQRRKNKPDEPIKDVQNYLKQLKITLESEFKIYVQRVLINSYSYPIGGEWSEDKENAQKLEDELDEKIKTLTNYLEGI